jgi:radical SAM protein with 4Fe4S-binding SPASM domain
MGLGVKGCTAALYNMCIEPNGDVLPCQSYYSSLGNIMEEDWQAIWEHDLAVSIRERRYLPQDCQSCVLLSTCGGGCPLAISQKVAVDPQYAVQL